MKKNTLGILLVAPIVISLLTFATTTILVNAMNVDIQDIILPYKENVPFQVKDEGVLLEAERVYDETKTLSEGNELVWAVSNATPSTEGEEVCQIRQEEDGGYYLYALAEGRATITCQNEKATVSKSFVAIVFENGGIVINPLEASSGSAINSTRYYGQYDLEYDENDTSTRNAYQKVPATVSLDVTCLIDGEESEEYAVSSCSSNVSYSNNVLTFTGSGEAYITYSSTDGGNVEGTYAFTIVENGVNVRSYDDLLRATNLSINGEIAVMQISLGSLLETYRHTENTSADGTTTVSYQDEYLSDNTRLFGHYDFRGDSFSFEDELYEFTSDYSTDYIAQYNRERGTRVSTQLKAALHVQKSIYGNGFSINMHNIAYPRNGTYDKVKMRLIPNKETDYFQGPLPYVFVGDPNDSYLAVEAYGQDNAGIYIDADNVVIDDLRIRNADDQDNRFNYSYTGTVVDIEDASNVIIRNSVISDGKNIVRAFSSDNLLIDNCILQDAGEYLLHLGSNRTNKADTSKTVSYTAGGQEVNKSFSEYFGTKYSEGDGVNADNVYDDLLFSSDEYTSEQKDVLIERLEGTQEALDNTSGIVNDDGSVNYDSHVTVRDTAFSSSGIYSIALDSMFNGGYLYDGYPSSLWERLDQYSSQFPVLENLVDGFLPPENIGGTSYPVELTLEGNTRFYDWKDIDSIDTSALIDENLMAMIMQALQGMGMGGEGGSAVEGFSLSIDDYFPIKAILKERAAEQNMIYDVDGASYINTSIIWYGGGLNLSNWNNSLTSTSNNFDGEVTLDMTHAYVYREHIGESLSPDLPDLAKQLVGMIATMIAAVTGSHDFKAVGDVVNGTPELYGKTPSIEDLRK